MSPEEHEKVLAEAERLARTGKYLTWWSIEKELAKTYRRARLSLGSKRIREHLNSICAAAAKGTDP